MEKVILFVFAAIGVGALTFNLSALLTLRYEDKKMPIPVSFAGAMLFVMSMLYLVTAGLMDAKRMKKVNKDHVQDMVKVRYLAELTAFPTVNECTKWGFSAPTKDQVHQKQFAEWRANEYKRLGLDKDEESAD